MKHPTMEIKPITSEEDYKETLINIESLLNCPPNSNEAKMLETLSILVDVYEKKHYPIEPIK